MTNDLNIEAASIWKRLRKSTLKIDHALADALALAGAKRSLGDTVNVIGQRWSSGRIRTRLCGAVLSRASDLELTCGWGMLNERGRRVAEYGQKVIEDRSLNDVDS